MTTFTPTPRTAAQRAALAEVREHQARVDAKAKKSKPWAPYASKTEWLFAQNIQVNKAMRETFCGGVIEQIDHQPVRHYLIPASDGAKGVSYRPDFRLRLHDAARNWTAWVEVKPAKRLRTERDSIVRAQVAATMMPWDRWFIARPDGQGGWNIREVGAKP